MSEIPCLLINIGRFDYKETNMSVFQVKLNNQYQGVLDTNPNTGAQFDPSIQRTMFVAGPHNTYREVADGTTFTDCNYWKRFAYPAVPETEAFIEVLSDDGTVYSNVAAENVYPQVDTGTLASGSAVTLDFTTNGGYAVFTQITANSGTMNVAMNGLAGATFPLTAGQTQIFNHGDVILSNLVLTSTDDTVNYQVISSIQATCET